MLIAPDFALHGSLVNIGGGAAGVWQTVAHMRALVNQYKSDPRIIHAAVTITFLNDAHDELGDISLLFSNVRDHIKYVRDVVGVETLCDPASILLRRVGDCDDQATLLATLLESVGYPTRFIVAGYNSDRNFEHVYLQVFAGGMWIDLDPTDHFQVGQAPPNPTIIQAENV